MEPTPVLPGGESISIKTENEDTPFWRAVALTRQQFEGLAAGYAYRANEDGADPEKTPQLEREDLMFLNGNGEESHEVE
jgi:hypothetical protein